MTFVLAALLCATAAPEGPGVVAGPAAEAVRFADWLFARGDYYRAIGEYERALFLDPDGDASPRVELRIADAYAAGGKTDAAVEILLRLAAQTRDVAVRDTALYDVGLVRYRARQPEAAATALGAYAALPSPAGGPGPERARLLLSLALLRAGDAGRARLSLDRIGAGGPLADGAAALRVAIDSVETAPRRSPLAAGLLSAAVPGLGHAYAGDPRAAVGALALNGVFVWATVDAFRARQYGLGALLLAGESIWYGGAIFGAVAEAMRFNHDARETALERVEERFRWVVDVVPGGATVGFAGPLEPRAARE